MCGFANDNGFHAFYLSAFVVEFQCIIGLTRELFPNCVALIGNSVRHTLFSNFDTVSLIVLTFWVLRCLEMRTEILLLCLRNVYQCKLSSQLLVVYSRARFCCPRRHQNCLRYLVLCRFQFFNNFSNFQHLISTKVSSVVIDSFTHAQHL